MKLGFFVSKKIDQLAKRSDDLMKNGKYADAVECYQKIIDLLPAPKEQWEAYEWSIVSIADTYYITEDYDKAEFYLYKINRHSPYLSITLHKCYPYYLFGISTFPNSAYHTTARRKFSITIV